MKSKHWLLEMTTTKHNWNPQIVRQKELLSSRAWKKKQLKQLGTPNVHVSHGYGSYWLTYVNCSHYKFIVTQNAQRKLVHEIREA